jgi:phosphate acetyltransferase
MDLMQDIIARAKADKQRIVLPEGTEERTLKAADRLLADGVADIILIGNPAEIKELAAGFGLNHIGEATLVDPKNHEKKAAYADLLFQLRQKKGMTPEKAAVLVEDPLFLACLMIKAGDADGEIAGAENTTGNVLRPALQIIKTRPGVHLVSGAFIMQRGRDERYLFADNAINIDPDADQLAEIAVESAKTAALFDIEPPRVALLSFSTKGSAKGPQVDKVVEATKKAHELAPDLALDGELQFDAAFVPSVAKQKAPDSKVAGEANVFIFPELQSGNIGYKIAQRFGGFEAIGPILQGLNQPVSDLSRGANEEDVYKLAIITAAQTLL